MIRTGVVGLGIIGVKRIKALPQELELVGVYDIESEKALKISQHYSTGSFTSVESLCEKVGVGGLLIVATNHQSLSKVAKIAIDKKINVLVEKPGAINAAE